MRSLPAIALVALMASFWATTASANMEDVVACRNISNDVARLACFDAAVPGVRAEIRAANEVDEATLEEEEDQRSFFGLPRLSLPNVLRRRETTEEEFGSASMEQRDARENGTTDELLEENRVLQEVELEVVEWGRNPYGKYFMVMDNGHVWRQTDDGRMPFRNSGVNTVIIHRARLGGFMMAVNGNNRYYRVERVR